jgi:predicted nucleic acid-binding protein
LGRQSGRDAHRPSILILIDTSAWVEFLRDTRSPVCERVDKLLDSRIATCDVVRMEVLAGARDQEHLVQLRRLLARATLLPTESIDYDTAAAVYRSCRSQGKTIRKLIDCLIAAVAMRANVTLLHLDQDFTAIAAVMDLRMDGV